MSHVTVIGSGAVGLGCADALVDRGLTVTVVDAGGERHGTSDANAGWVSPGHVIPFAAPGMVGLGVNSVLKRTGAFSVNPMAGAPLAKWMTSFLRNCTEANVDFGVPVLRELLDSSVERFTELTKNHGLDRTERELWYLYGGANADHEADHEVEHMSHYGVSVHHVDRKAALEEEPLLQDSVRRVVAFSADYGVDPKQLLEVLHNLIIKAGAQVKDNQTVSSVKPTGNGVTITTDKESWTSDYVVLAAGVWTRDLARSLGTNLNLVAAKGHSVTVPGVEHLPKRIMLLTDHRIATNSLSWGLRLSTGYGLTTNSDRKISPSAIDGLYRKAGTMFKLPQRPANINPWTGLRPSSPDGLPYIGALAGQPKVLVATGHGMLGTMLATGTGRLIADFVTGTQVSPEMVKLSPARPR